MAVLMTIAVIAMPRARALPGEIEPAADALPDLLVPTSMESDHA
jgi:hypothetical protein